MKRICLVFFICLVQLSFAQQPPKPSAVEIFETIKKLNFFGNIMYVAAHPDDENTRLIAYFSKHYHAHTTYISLTRGDGGQNLLGADLNEKLGIIRTQELLAARKIDGGHQLFTRAIDFGYSKNPDEALSTWNKNEVLADLVFAIRKNKPDIIVNRFDHRTPGTTHGHHTASAILAMQAFDLSANKNAFPEQLKLVEPWQPQAIYFNDSWFFYINREAFQNANHEQHLAINMGEFYPDIGLHNSEIAALSRSMHKSQGFGNTGTRGDQIEYLELLKGELPSAENLFENIETSWKRLQDKQYKKIQQHLLQVEANFDYQNPHQSIPALVEAYTLLQQAKNSFWKDRKIKELKELIVACSGLFLEARTTETYTNPGKKVQVFVEVTNQSNTEIKLKSVRVLGSESNEINNINLLPNQKNEWETQIEIPLNQVSSNPFWLNQQPGKALYKVDEIWKRNLPEISNTLPIAFQLEINGQSFNITRNLVYKYNDPVDGEVYENFLILPPVSLSFQKNIMVFSGEEAKEVQLNLTNYGSTEALQINFNPTSAWKVEPEQLKVKFNNLNETQKVKLKVTPPKDASELNLMPKATNLNGIVYNSKVEVLDYTHIPKQSFIQPSQLQLIKLDVQTKGEKVAYIQGAGDDVAEAILELGYQVEVFSVEDISSEKLQSFDAVVVGIRAFNIYDAFAFKKQTLFNYVKNGGNLIVQYNTSRGLKTEISPLPLQLSRNRVTDEYAEVQFLAPNHPILNFPNKITPTDFENWVQERGLYFSDQWSDKFIAILGMQDPNEPILKGSLLTTTYGDGHFTYTGLSFFRQLPAGVKGAYRLLANLLSLGNEK